MPFQDLLPDVSEPPIAIIPAEQISLHTVQLPFRSARQRRDALPFALEEQIGTALEQTHFALLGAAPNGKILAAAVGITQLEGLMERFPGRRIIPEQMLIMPPVTGSDGEPVWRVYSAKNRSLVRCSDATGFALRTDMLAPIWRAAGTPVIQCFGAPLPKEIDYEDCTQLPMPRPEDLDTYDVRQGDYQPPRGYALPLRMMAASIAVALLLHLGTAALDARAQKNIADDLRSAAEQSLAQHLPDASPDDAPATLARRLSALDQPQGGSGFLPLMDRVAGALAAQPQSVQFRQLDWSGDSLRLGVEAADLGTLQEAEASLKAQGLQVSLGSSSADAGAARADLTVRP